MDTIWEGEEKFIWCADIGTTQSAVSLIHLQPQTVPKVKLVSRYPGNRLSSKIPSLMLYNDAGVPMSHGAEALHENVQIQAEDEGWFTCRYWKLWLNTRLNAPPPYEAIPSAIVSGVERLALDSRDNRGLGGGSFELSPLPPGVPIEQVYQDWISYLYQCAKTWWCESNPDGAYIWNKLESQMIFVLAHPNGYGLHEQGILRAALANAIPIAEIDPLTDTERVVFVSEAEAAVHFCLHYSSSSSGPNSWLSRFAQFAVVDCGGSTVDTTVYSVDQASPKLKLREVKPSGCVQAGAIYPTRDFALLVKAKLANSRFADPETINEIVAEFDRKTKCDFDDLGADHIIKMGKDSMNDPTNGIRRGRLTLKGAEVGQAFKASIDLILESVADQLRDCNVKTLLLSGGFGESPHLQRRLRERYESAGVKLITADMPSSKAVAEGCGFYYLKDSVVARSVRFSFGTTVMRKVSDWPPHLLNVGLFKSFLDVDGSSWQRGGFKLILPRGTVMDTMGVISESFSQDCSCDGAELASSTKIFIRKNDSLEKDSFMIDTRGEYLPDYQHVFDVTADLTGLCTDAAKRKSPHEEGYYWHVEYQIGIMFGGTSLKAFVFWTENGVEKKGPASIVPSAYT